MQIHHHHLSCSLDPVVCTIQPLHLSPCQKMWASFSILFLNYFIVWYSWSLKQLRRKPFQCLNHFLLKLKFRQIVKLAKWSPAFNRLLQTHCYFSHAGDHIWKQWRRELSWWQSNRKTSHRGGYILQQETLKHRALH